MTSPLEHSELTAISDTDTDKIAVNCQSDRRLRQQRDYIGCISAKRIKGIVYWYWVYRDRGKRHYRCMGTDRSSAISKARAVHDPRT